MPRPDGPAPLPWREAKRNPRQSGNGSFYCQCKHVKKKRLICGEHFVDYSGWKRHAKRDHYYRNSQLEYEYPREAYDRSYGLAAEFEDEPDLERLFYWWITKGKGYARLRTLIDRRAVDSNDPAHAPPKKRWRTVGKGCARPKWKWKQGKRELANDLAKKRRLGKLPLWPWERHYVYTKEERKWDRKRPKFYAEPPSPRADSEDDEPLSDDELDDDDPALMEDDEFEDTESEESESEEEDDEMGHDSSIPTPRLDKGKARALPAIDEEDEEAEQLSPVPFSKIDKGKERAPPSSILGDEVTERDEAGMDAGEGYDFGGDYDDAVPPVKAASHVEHPASAPCEKTTSDQIGGPTSDDELPPRQRTSARPKQQPLRTTTAKQPSRSSFASRSGQKRKSTNARVEPELKISRVVQKYKRRTSGGMVLESETRILEPRRDQQKRFGRRRKSERAAPPPVILEDIEAKAHGTSEEPYAGWDDDVAAEAVVWNPYEGKEELRDIVHPQHLAQLEPVANGSYKMQSIFQEGAYMACRRMELPVGSIKSLKSAKDNNYVIYVEQGAARVLIHRNIFTLVQGGLCHVPPGNVYEIENIGEEVCRAIFFQAREVQVEAGEPFHDYDADMDGQNPEDAATEEEGQMSDA